MTHAEVKILYDELKMLERSIMGDVKSAAETTLYGLDRDPLDREEALQLARTYLSYLPESKTALYSEDLW